VHWLPCWQGAGISNGWQAGPKFDSDSMRLWKSTDPIADRMNSNLVHDHADRLICEGKPQL